MFRPFSETEIRGLNAAGIVLEGAMGWARHDGRADREFLALDEAQERMAMDAIVGTQPGLITLPNAGIPAFLTTYVDPKLIEVLLAPNKAAEILDEVRKGDWLMQTAMFPMIEVTGEVSSYNDFSENGRSDANAQFENRQSYYYQTFVEWGEQEMERYALAKIDWASRKNIAASINLGKFQNLSYFNGIRGLENYGLLNDPALAAPITPAIKAAGGTGWQDATPNEIVADVQALFAELQNQTTGTAGLAALDSEMTLALDPESEVWLMNTNSFGLSAMGILKTIFKKLRVVSAVQYQVDDVHSCQLILKEVEAQQVAYCAFTEKLRAHRVIANTSSWKQKKSQGTWGTIITFPAGIAQMVGI